jgi:glycine/D-amino acid oxidase-like deaminating enzyme
VLPASLSFTCIHIREKVVCHFKFVVLVMMAAAALSCVWDQGPLPGPVASAAIEASEDNDLVIVGGGILGLSTGLHAARLGLKVRILDAGEIGGAASGLNGGQVIPGLKHDPDWLMAHFGAVRGAELVRFAAGTADAVFDLIEREGLNVPHVRTGWIQAAVSSAAAEAGARRAQQWQARGVAAKVLSAAEVAAATGAEGYVGGWLDPRAGVIQPLAYTRELARLAVAAGVKIAANTRATKLARVAGGWRVETSSGSTIGAKAVLVATNAYTDALVPGLARTLLPLNSLQIATAPLPAEARAAILPEGQAVSDSRRILVYYRKSPDGRLMLGGRGPMAAPTGPGDWAHLERAMLRLFPALSGIAIERRWFGRVAMTLDHLPHLHEPERGLLAAVGCQGRGVGLMTALGPYLARAIVSGDRGELPFPLTPIRPIPLHCFRHIGIGAAIAWYRLIDAVGL